MFDFRYHTLSLVAVFLALGIGILLGATLGDSLVSEANRDLRSSLRGDVLNARRNAQDAQTQLQRRDQLIARTAPVLTSDRLRGRRVVLVAYGSLPGNVESAVRQAVGMAGGDLNSVATLQLPPDAQTVPAAVSDFAPVIGGRYSDPKAAASDLGGLGTELGDAVASPGSTARDLQHAFPNRFRGDFSGEDAVVFYGLPVPSGPGSAPALALEDGVVAGLRVPNIPVVGVEDSAAQPSQTPYYQARGLSSVDSVDLAGGQIALVYALAGSRGNFGYKDTADKPLPDLPVQPGGP